MKKKILKSLIPIASIFAVAPVASFVTSCSKSGIPTFFNDFHHCDFNDFRTKETIDGLLFRLSKRVTLRNANITPVGDTIIKYPKSWGESKPIQDFKFDFDNGPTGTLQLLFVTLERSQMSLPENLANGDTVEITQKVRCYNGESTESIIYWESTWTFKFIHQVK